MSRATELNFRHPKEISDAIYHPDVSQFDNLTSYFRLHIMASNFNSQQRMLAPKISLKFFHSALQTFVYQNIVWMKESKVPSLDHKIMTINLRLPTFIPHPAQLYSANLTARMLMIVLLWCMDQLRSTSLPLKKQMKGEIWSKRLRICLICREHRYLGQSIQPLWRKQLFGAPPNLSKS